MTHDNLMTLLATLHTNALDMVRDMERVRAENVFTDENEITLLLLMSTASEFLAANFAILRRKLGA